MFYTRDEFDARAMDQKHLQEIGRKLATSVGRSAICQCLAADAIDNAHLTVGHRERHNVSVPVKSLCSAPKRHSVPLCLTSRCDCYSFEFKRDQKESPATWPGAQSCCFSRRSLRLAAAANNAILSRISNEAFGIF